MKKRCIAGLLAGVMLTSLMPIAGAQEPTGLTGSISGETFDASSTANTTKLTETSEPASNAADFTSVAVQAQAGQKLVYKDIDFTGAKVLMMEAAIESGSTSQDIALYVDGVDEANRIGTLTTRSTAKVDDLDFNEQYAELTKDIVGTHDLILQFSDTTCLELDFLNLTSYTGSETEEERDARMEWWRDAKFGQFIHMGAYSYLGGYYNGNKAPGYSEWIMDKAKIDLETYSQEAAAKFNPKDFDAEKIVSDAKASGQQYLIITSRHHEGFSIFDTQIREFRDYSLFSYADQSGYNGVDPLKALSQECQKQGLHFGVYITIMDWRDPSQNSWNRGIAEGHTKEEYKARLKGQVKELIEEYGVEVFFFDGEWDSWWTKADGQEVYRYILSLNENCIVNNRVGKRHADDGDYGTPEQEIPSTGLDYDWESCMTMNDNWGYCKGDNNWKSTQWIVENVLDIASKGGNLLLNVGPNGDGVVEAKPLAHMAEAGQWLEQFGEAVYGTRANCFESGVPSNVRITTKPDEGKVYVSLLRDDPASVGTIKIPALENQILSVKDLAAGTDVPYQVVGNDLFLTVAGTEKQDYATVYEITVEGVPTPVNPAEDTRENYAYGATTEASSVYDSGHGVNKLVDGDTSANNRWAPLDSDGDPYAIVDLGQERTIGEVVLYEWLDTKLDKGYRCSSFKIAVSTDKTTWTDVHTGTTIGERLSVVLDESVQARYIKVYALKGTKNGNVSLHEMQVYEKPIPKSEIHITSTDKLVDIAPFTVEGTYANGTSVEVKVWGASFPSFTVPAVLDAEKGTWTATVDSDVLQAGSLTITANLKNEEDIVTAMDVYTVEYLGRENFAEGKEFTASSVYEDVPNIGRDFSANKLGDGILSGRDERWAPDDATDKSPWVYVDLGETRTVDEVVLYEWMDTYNGNVYRCKSFEISVSNDGQQWETVYTGTAIGERLSVVLDQPVQARYVKVEKLVGSDKGNVSLHEMMVFGKEDVPVEPANKTLLQKTYDYAVTLSTDGVTDTAKKAFDEALANAKAVLDNPNATQAEVDAAWDALLEGIWGLGLTQGDKTMLEQLIAKAEDMTANADKYVADHWQELVDALAKAKDVAADGDAMEEDVQPAAQALLDAILAQRFKADKSILEDLLNKAENLNLEGYTAESVAVFRSALAEAQAVLADETLTEDDQKTVDAAVKALTTAMDGLTAEGEAQPTDSPEATDKPESTDKPQATQQPESNVPQTGDTAALLPWAAALALSGAAALWVVRRKERN